MTDLLLLPPRGFHTKRLTTSELAEKLQLASDQVNGDVPFWERTGRCLLLQARSALLAATRRYEGARKVNERLRRQRNEARQGVVKAAWWNDMDNPESGYDDPSEALSEVGPEELVCLTGSVEIERIYGFRTVNDDENEEDHWFNTLEEAKEALKRHIASKTATAKVTE